MTNRLALEASPYLLQHAHNPVDWYPWGPDAFARAKNLERLVLVSVGYAACHWCHVMEKECFAVPEIAEVMNRHLVCIKVDREERPDIDRVMMTALQALTGQGGWPLNIFLTPQGDPLIGGTYFPPQDRGSLPAWPRLIERLAGAWNHFDSRRDLTRRGLDLRLALTQHFSPVGKTSHTLLKAETVAETALTALLKRYDPHFGGFSGAPKFPMPVHLQFLLAYASLLGTEHPKYRTLLDPALHTLKSMSRGGLCDQVGGGFHRYSTDDEWRLPHFEKMLNDNALLAATLAEAVQITSDEELARATRRTLDYLLRDLRHPQGGFFTSEDADSPPATGVAEKTEGAFYLWSWEELSSLLEKKLPGMAKIFDLKPEGNFHDPHAPNSKNNILHGARPGPTHPGDSPRFQNGEVDGFLDLLRQARDQRPRPDRDEKILTGWNGLALTALAKGFDALGDDRYLTAAQQTAEFLYAHLWDVSTQTLFRRWRDGHRAIPAQAEDVSFLMAGLLDLFSSSGEARWLTWAHSLGEIFIRDFLDPASGRVFTTPPGSDPCLILRPLDEGDHVDPSAAALAAESLAKLGRYFGRAEWEKTAGQMIQPLLALAPEQPLSFSRVLRTALFLEAPPGSKILQGSPQSPETQALGRALRKRFDPFSLLLFADGGETEKLLVSHLPHLAALPPSDHPQIWPCEGTSCQPPLRTL